VTQRDFFVSYHQADRGWAEWIAWQLEAAGHSVLVQAWDFVPGTNWIQMMQDGVSNSERVIIVMSSDYLASSVFGAAEWQAVWAKDPTGAQRRVLPVRVARCERPGLLTGIVGVDLFDITEPQAHQRLHDAIDHALVGRAKPLTAPAFPAASGRTPAGQAPDGKATDTPPTTPQFPGSKYTVNLHNAKGVQMGDGNTQVNQW
jgi:hypothetical protein